MAADNPGQVVRVNSATLIIGVTGSGKSSLLATAAEYVWDRYKLVSRLTTTDGGGFPDRIEALMRRGIMQVWRARTRDLPDGSLSFETCRRAAQGWWPQRINPRTGECRPGERLVPPVTERYDMRCLNGHLIKSVPFQALLTPALCPTCRTHTTKENMRVTKSAHRTKGFETVGAQMFDGLTSMTSWWMSDMSQRAGRLELKGEEGAIGGKVRSGDLSLGSNSRSHYGFAQSEAEQVILGSLSIPYLVIPPIFTALTLESTDEGGLSIRGPKLAGSAKTDECPQWVGNCLEAAVVKNERDEPQFRLYLSEFVDDAGARHLLKHRGAPGTMPPWLEDPAISPSGNVAQTAFTQCNLGVFFDLMDAGLATTLATVDAKYPDAPGVPDGFMEVGESTAVVPAPAQGQPAAATGASTGVHTPAAAITAGATPPPVVRGTTRAAAPTAKAPAARRAAAPGAAAPAPAVLSGFAPAAPALAPVAPVVDAPLPPAEVQAIADGRDPTDAQPEPTPEPEPTPAEQPTVTEPAVAPAPSPTPVPAAPAAPAVVASPAGQASDGPPQQVAGVPVGVQEQQVSAGAAPGARKWAPPSSPRPPAVAPRIRPVVAPTPASEAK